MTDTYPPKTVLGFDCGLKYIGIAIGQSITGTATPLGSIKAHLGIPNWDQLNQLLQRWQPDILLVGLPLAPDGSDHGITKMARRFMRELRQHYPLTVYPVDERYTTLEAKKQLYQIYGSAGLTKSKIDGWAAKIITEDGLRMMVTQP